MSLPPEQINIKRRREEEPVETLYIQSELHQTKRRFTDFVFQRVLAGGNGTNKSSASSPSPTPTGQRTLRTPRSTSSLNFTSTSRSLLATASGVPSVRATSPGAEFREQKRLAAARKEAEEKFTVLQPSPVRPKTASSLSAMANVPSGRPSTLSRQESTLSVRTFHISRPSTPVGVHKGIGSGIQKRRGGSASGIAVLVEKLRPPHSRKASMVADTLAAEGAVPVGKPRSPLVSEEPVRPRKRPVVNQAEKRWREEHRRDISSAKQHIMQMADASHADSDDGYERLAKQFEQVALDLESGMDTAATEVKEIPPAPTKPSLPKPPLKYQPRVPNRPRSNVSETLAESDGAHAEEVRQVSPAQPTPEAPHASEQGKGDSDDDGDYVYDTYIRRPLPPSGQLSNPLSDLETTEDTWFRQNGIDVSRPDVGVIVIPAEDEQYWETFAEDDEDEDEWDSDDADSNAENNPAYDYPDEEMSWDDEDDDPTAIYSKYRDRAASDDEEFGIFDSASEGENRHEY